MDFASRTRIIKNTAASLGFSFCGISKAEFLTEEAPRLEEWLKRGYQGKMSYLENYFDKRLDPTLLVPGAKSVISLLYNYYPGQRSGRWRCAQDFKVRVRRRLSCGDQRQAQIISSKNFTMKSVTSMVACSSTRRQ